MQRQWEPDGALPDHAALGALGRIKMTSENILTTVNMALKAIKSDLESEIIHTKLETALAPGTRRTSGIKTNKKSLSNIKAQLKADIE